MTGRQAFWITLAAAAGFMAFALWAGWALRGATEGTGPTAEEERLRSRADSAYATLARSREDNAEQMDYIDTLAQRLSNEERTTAVLETLLADARSATDSSLRRVEQAGRARVGASAGAATIRNPSPTQGEPEAAPNRDDGARLELLLAAERAAADSVIASCASRAARWQETAGLYRTAAATAAHGADEALAGLEAARAAYALAAARVEPTPRVYVGASYGEGLSAQAVAPVRLPVIGRAAITITAGACNAAGIAVAF